VASEADKLADPILAQLDRFRTHQLRKFVRDRGQDCSECSDRIQWLERAREVKDLPEIVSEEEEEL